MMGADKSRVLVVIGCCNDRIAPPRIRHAMQSDVSPLCDILNAIIRIGGTTALEEPLTEAKFTEYFIGGAQFLACLVAEDARSGSLLGFQALSRHPDLPKDWADIATFAKTEPKTPGVGTALFATTWTRARALKLAAINAEIRADNCGGLAYYEKMGFETYKVLKGVPLRSGAPVDRILKRYFVR
jgi:L-amino acid N-acyltransferase YncA